MRSDPGRTPVVLENVRFLAAGRRLELIDADVLVVLKAVVSDGMTIGEASSLAERAGAARARIRPALLSLIWWGVWSASLSSSLASGTVICVPSARR